MTITVADYINVKEKVATLGGSAPQRLALIPINFESAKMASELLQPSEAATVRTLFKNNQIPLEELFSKSQYRGYVQNNSFEWVAPIIFIGSSLLSESPEMVSLALSVFASYITDFFKGMPGKNTVRLEFIIEKHNDYTCKTLRYEGDVSGILSIKDEILRIGNE